MINGGAHSSAPIDFQEFMIAPVGAKTFSDGLRMVTEISTPQESSQGRRLWKNDRR